MFLSRRSLMLGLAGLAACRKAAPDLRITSFELVPVRASVRTVWLFVRLHTDAGLSGLGEASDAFGFANTTKEDAQTMETDLRGYFELLAGRSPFDVERYRAAGRARAKSQGLIAATAFSALEQSLWDLAGQALGVPAYQLLGGAVRTSLPVYANINRATLPRTPEGFADAARRAWREGFRAMKAAPFDGFPPPGSPPEQIKAALDAGIAATAAMRHAVGDDVALMIDCHSFFDVERAREVAGRLEPFHLTWYEEPVAPEKTAETLAIHQSIQQPMAGGELLFGVEGFAPLCQQRAVDVIMPDVKHCGGLLEMTHIAALAAAHGIGVAPHNPSGPVSTAASVQMCAGMPNFRYMELQWGEAAWRGSLLDPPERFTDGSIAVPTQPGFGVSLNDKLAQQHRL